MDLELRGNLKVFAKAIQAMSRLGDQLHMEPTSNGLALRAFNSTHSAYGCCFFASTFFAHFEATDAEIATGHDEEGTASSSLYKISMKNALLLFKYAHHMEKTILSCRMQLEANSDRLHVRFALRHDAIRYVEMPLIDSPTSFSPIFDKNLLLNLVVAPSKMVMQLLNQLKANADELSFQFSQDEAIIRNYHPFDPERSRNVLKTEARLLSREFDRFAVRLPSNITCSLREFSAVVSFADLMVMPVSLYFDKPGRPLVVSLETHIDFSVDFVIGTLEADMMVGQPTATVASSASNSTIPLKPPVRREMDREFEDEVMNLLREENGEDADVFPASPSPPASKRFRSYFLGASQCTMHCSQLDQSVLADDSDTER